MKKVIRNYRYYVLAILWTIGFISGVAAISESAEYATQKEYMIYSIKAIVISFCAFYAHRKAFNFWDKKGKIHELSDFIRKED